MNYKKILKVAGVVAVAAIFCVGCSDEDGGEGGDGGTIKIGNQTWMAKNLNRATANSKCYYNSADSCAKYGRLYTWTDAKSACPSGWHLPSDAEWATLEDAVGGSSIAGTKLKATSGWSRGGSGTDEYNFSALPGGYAYSDGSFNNGGAGHWWTATEAPALLFEVNLAWSRHIRYGSENVERIDFLKTALLSVRCVED